MLREAGNASADLGLLAEAQSYLEQAITSYSVRQDLSGESSTLRSLANILRQQGHHDQGRNLAMRAVELLKQQAPGEHCHVPMATSLF